MSMTSSLDLSSKLVHTTSSIASLVCLMGLQSTSCLKRYIHTGTRFSLNKLVFNIIKAYQIHVSESLMFVFSRPSLLSYVAYDLLSNLICFSNHNL